MYVEIPKLISQRNTAQCGRTVNVPTIKRKGGRYVQPLVMAIGWLVGLQKITQNPFRSDRFLQIWFDIFGHGMETTCHGWKVYSKKL